MIEKRVLITGGTGFFGRALTLDLIKHGWEVVITTRKVANATDVIKDAGNHGDRIHVIPFDYLQDPKLSDLISNLDHQGLSITHLVNNARSLSSLEVGKNGVTDPEVFDLEFRLDVLLPYQLSMALANSKSHPLNVIVNIGSQYGEVVPSPMLYEGTLKDNPIQYGVSKAALHHMTKELAVRLASKKIRVNCIAFGGVQGRVDEAFRRRYGTMLPLGRMLELEEVPGPVRFLLSEESSAVNGHILVVDGGWSV